MNNLLQLFNQFSGSGSSTAPLIIIAIAFAAGILASISPCSLGVLPLITGYIGGYSKSGNKKLFIQMISFSLGLSFVLSIVGVLCAITGKAFTGAASPVLLLLFSSFILCLGLNLLGILDIQFPAIVKKMPENKTGSMFIFPFAAGCLFSLAASPCASPILAAILAFATVSSSILLSILIMFAFALGQCVIIILFAMFTSLIKHAEIFAKFGELMIKLSGILLAGFALYIWYSVFKSII